MNSSKLLLLVIGLLSMLAGALLFNLLQPDPPRAPNASDTAIELHSIPLTDLAGKQTRIADWRGKILLINLWAPWCAPCRREVPTLIESYRDYSERGLVILGIALDGEQPVREFAAEYQINYPLFVAGNRSVMYNSAFGNPSGSLPFTALLDENYRIVFKHNGEITAKQLREKLEALL